MTASRVRWEACSASGTEGHDVGPPGRADAELHCLLDPDQLGQPLPQLGVAGQLQEQRGRQLAGGREQLVVDVELALDLLVG